MIAFLINSLGFFKVKVSGWRFDCDLYEMRNLAFQCEKFWLHVFGSWLQQCSVNVLLDIFIISIVGFKLEILKKKNFSWEMMVSKKEFILGKYVK